MSIIAIAFILALGVLTHANSTPFYHKATFTFSHECKQVKADNEVCVDLKLGETALYAPKEG